MGIELVKILDGVITTTNLAVKNGATSLPLKSEGFFDLRGRTAKGVRITFGGTRTNSDNEDFAYQVFIWRKRGDLVTDATRTLYDPEEVARGVVTLGTQTYTDGGAAHYIGDTITQTLTARPHVYVFSPADNREAFLVVDAKGALGVQVIIDINAGADAAATADVFGQPLSAEEMQWLPFELLADLKARLGASYTADGGTDVGDSVYADMQAMVKYDGWRMATKTFGTPGGGASANIATVTGVVEAKVIGVVDVDIAGTGAETLTVTCGGKTVIAATTATDLTTGDIWHDAAPDASAEDASQFEAYFINGVPIVLAQSGAASSWGVASLLTFYILWRPVSSNGVLAAA